MYLHDELIVLGLIFIDAIVIFYLYRYIKDQYKTRIEELQKEIHLLNNKSLPVKESGFSNTKKSFVLEQIAKLMHGDITFKNNTPKGSIFTFYLPNIEIALKDDTVTCKDEKQIDFSLISPNGAKIIVIDSDNNTQKTLQRCFADTAVKVYTFANAKEAIEKLKEHSFDMILIDIDTLCAEQSAISKVIAKVSDAPVITLVNTRLKDKDLDAVKAKVLGHLKKPICEAELFKISLKSIRKL